MRKIKKLCILTALFCMTSAPLQSFAAGTVTTPKSSLPKNTDVDKCTVTVNGDSGARTFRVYAQNPSTLKKRTYISMHGCAASALTTVLSGYTKNYAKYTPAKTRKLLEKKVFGTKKWKANYNKSLSRQMPVSLYGISRVLNYCKIPSKYVRYFKDTKAVKEIENHLKTGNAVIIEVNNHKQKNGKISSAYTTKWATSKHTMALLGMTDTGKVIVADSAYRSWSGKKQRIKYTTMKELVQYMIPCKVTSKSYYYTSVAASGGYVLVNVK